jgi:dienelactone hydrolase
MRQFPRPNGPYAVGSVTHGMTDPSRPAHVLSDRPGRQLFLKLWYPATASVEATASERERLWDELRARPGVPLPLRWMLAILRRVRTYARPSALYAHDVHSPRLVIYNHGLISFASENTSLAEALASYGCVVVAIEHLEQFPEWQSLNRQKPADRPKQGSAIAARLKMATPAERAQIGPEYYRSADNANRVVQARVEDVTFVLQHIDSILERIPGFGGTNPDFGELALVGLSLGGAVATEFAAQRGSVTAVVNLDGGFFGGCQGGLITASYLMMYSSESEGINDALLPKQARSIAGPFTKHLNYHDIATMMPFLRYAGMLGKARAKDFIQLRNHEVCRFLQRTVR